MSRKTVLVLAALACLGAMIYFLPEVQAQTIDEVRIIELDRRVSALDNVPTRLIVLESEVSQMLSLLRWLGAAIALAIIEKLMSAFGISLKRN